MNDYRPHSPGDDERLRRLLNDAVSDVEPRESLDAIRTRTVATSSRPRRHWMWGAGAAVVATAATVAAVTVVGGSPGSAGRQGPGPAAGPTGAASTAPSQVLRSAEPSDTPSSPNPSQEAPATVSSIPVYYPGETGHGLRLYREFHRTSDGDPALAALTDAVAGTPLDPDYRQVWPDGTSVRAFHVDGTGDSGLITVDLAGGPASLKDRPAGMDADTAHMAVQQLVYTAQAVTQTRAPVRLLLDGQETDTVLGEPTAKPLSEGEDLATLSLVWVTEPAQGASVTSPFRVEGVAATFEANVVWELKQGDTVVKQGHTTAREAYTMAPYSFTVDVPPGHYTLVVHDSDAAGEGGPGYRDTKQITVTD